MQITRPCLTLPFICIDQFTQMCISNKNNNNKQKNICINKYITFLPSSIPTFDSSSIIPLHVFFFSRTPDKFLNFLNGVEHRTRNILLNLIL